MASRRKILLRKWYESKGQRRCVYCHCQLHFNHGSPNFATKDHIIPKSKGGVGLLNNYLMCCEACNKERGNKDFALWVKGRPNEQWLLSKLGQVQKPH